MNFFRGAPLFVSILLLGGMNLIYPPLAMPALAALAFLYLLTLTSIHAAESPRRSNPGRRQGRPLRETDLSES